MPTALFMKWTPAAGPEIKILRNKEEKVILEVQKVILEPKNGGTGQLRTQEKKKKVDIVTMGQ